MMIFLQINLDSLLEFRKAEINEIYISIWNAALHPEKALTQRFNHNRDMRWKLKKIILLFIRRKNFKVFEFSSR